MRTRALSEEQRKAILALAAAPVRCSEFRADFFNAWNASELQRRVSGCVNAGYICGNDGSPIQQ
ncbi:hypothetical protein [Wenjunlia tyrosinilytica]|uniref:Uncharacterized protein n=1 Tax=Wenjunlia tyrosinilytica TaxID=1544741 RepID=A0A917ZMH4_9ACTN|nr:hypothetical protein [Wenjunlia tyrosinilytica]GGO85201.1 hypothetical protein GCM10012280_18440 [Wenjunlia tyrosinilytica]